MNRRNFLTRLGLVAGGLALDQAIPFNRVWSFPKEIVVAQSGSRLTVNALAGNIFNVGDVFTIANVNGVHPRTGQPTFPRYFVVARTLIASGTDDDVLEIAPSIYGPGSQYQNVDRLPLRKTSIIPEPRPAFHR